MAFWLLTVLFVTTAYTTMANIRAGWFTSYAADVVVPAFMYIGLRELHRPARRARWILSRWFGSVPEMTAGVLFLGSVATEISQRYWPTGFFRGTFDPWDVAAYFVGVTIPYVLDRKGL